MARRREDANVLAVLFGPLLRPAVVGQLGQVVRRHRTFVRAVQELGVKRELDRKVV